MSNVFLLAGNSPSIKSSTATLTNSQILSLPSTPFVMVSSAGTGNAILPIMAYVKSNITGAYTNIGNNCIVAFDYIVAAPDFAEIFNDLSVGTSPVNDLLTSNRIFNLGYMPFNPYSTSLNGYCATERTESGSNLNLYLSVYNDNGAGFSNLGNFTGGNSSNTLKVTMFYVIVNV